jgi:hypothetical protein
MSTETDKIELPAFLASALINGDSSGLETFENHRDFVLLDYILTELSKDGWTVIDCGEQYFGTFNGLGSHIVSWSDCDLCEYTISRNTNNEKTENK